MTPNDSIDGAHLPAELRRVVRDAMPIYCSAWWPAHSRRNDEWIASMRQLLIDSELCLARRAEDVLRARWPADSIHVDATVYANWFGAYSTRPPTRITIAANTRGSQGSYGLEVLVHESAHRMLDPIDSALVEESARRRKQLPRELSHLLLFYTAGALVREVDPGARAVGRSIRCLATESPRVDVPRVDQGGVAAVSLRVAQLRRRNRGPRSATSR